MTTPRPLDSPLIVTLRFDPGTFDRLDALRARFFPPERNLIPAHLSLFHALPGAEIESVSDELEAAAACSAPIRLRFGSVMPLGSGMALKADAPGLSRVHRRLADAFGAWLTPQDRQPLRPHVTLMNKADRADARHALAQYRDEFTPFDGLGDALGLWAYLGGPWQSLARYPLSGPTSSPSEH